MTWYYDTTDGSEMIVYNHDKTEVERIPNDGTGFSIPGDVFDSMEREVDNSLPTGVVTATKVLRDAIFEKIEETSGPPEFSG